MKIVSFNINGLRARPHQLQALIETHQPDVIGLQETKVSDEQFPEAEIRQLGYHVHYHGQKGHYGVALLSRKEPLALHKGFATDDEDALVEAVDGLITALMRAILHHPDFQALEAAWRGLQSLPVELVGEKALHFESEPALAAYAAVKAAKGGAFFLCTSLRAMRRTHELLAEQLERAGLDFPLLIQGEGSKNELLERFRRLGNAILVGSQSFWEGVDVRGEALSLVVIDKLPFAPPDDPVLSARIERMKTEGRNAFMDYQLPRAVINVKQGAGRLIRDETDRGVLMICDPRLITKPYGKRVWRSLPPMKRTRELNVVLDFFGEAE